MTLVVAGPTRANDKFPLILLTKGTLQYTGPVKGIVSSSVRKRYCTIVKGKRLSRKNGFIYHAVGTVPFSYTIACDPLHACRYAHALGIARIVAATRSPIERSGQAGGCDVRGLCPGTRSMTEDPLKQAVPVKRIVSSSIRKRKCNMIGKERVASPAGRYAHALGIVRIVTPTTNPVARTGQAFDG
jgi:hypothetical protein